MRRTSVAETCIGIFILVLLAAIAGGIYISQSMFDPGFYNAALQKDGNGTTRRNSLPLPDAAPLPAYLPENLVPLGPEETFDPETLSDKIDGKAELYLSSGFVKLTTRRFAKKGNPGDWLNSTYTTWETPQTRSRSTACRKEKTRSRLTSAFQPTPLRMRSSSPMGLNTSK